MEKPIGPLTNKTKVRQIVIPDVTSIIESLFIRFGTFCRKNESHIKVVLSCDSKILQSWEIDAKNLLDNSYQEFCFDKEIETTSYPSIWNIEISCSAKNENNGVALFYDDEKTNSVFYVDYRQIKGSLLLDFKSRPNAENFEYNCIGKSGLISVIIPSYNCSDFLEKCINSVINQTYNNTEIFVVDDGSERKFVEKTRFIVEKIKKTNSLVSLIELPKNRGASAARNEGAKNAIGEFLFFLDSDTFLNNNAFEMMINSLHSHPECSYAYCKFKWGDRIVSGSPFDRQRIKRCNFASMMSLLRFADFPEGGLDESLPRYQDWDLWLTLLKNGKIGTWIDDCLFESIERENSISSGGSITDREARMILSKKHAEWADITIF